MNPSSHQRANLLNGKRFCLPNPRLGDVFVSCSQCPCKCSGPVWDLRNSRPAISFGRLIGVASSHSNAKALYARFPNPRLKIAANQIDRRCGHDDPPSRGTLPIPQCLFRTQLEVKPRTLNVYKAPTPRTCPQAEPPVESHAKLTNVLSSTLRWWVHSSWESFDRPSRSGKFFSLLFSAFHPDDKPPIFVNRYDTLSSPS